MRLYLFNPIILLCLSALLCTSQDLVQETLDMDIIQPGHLANNNESYPLASRLFSRTGTGTEPGPVEAAVKIATHHSNNHMIGEGRFGKVFWIEHGFLVGNKKTAAAVKIVLMHTHVDRDWMRLELAYLDAVGQLLAYGVRKGEPDAYCIVMPYLGMTMMAAVYKHGMQEGLITRLTTGLVASHAQKFGVHFLDNPLPNTVFHKIPSDPTGWRAYLIDWGYAQFASQPHPPKLQEYSPECQPPDKCVYHAVKYNLGESIEMGSTSSFSTYHRLKKDFDKFPATVRKMEVRTIITGRTLHHEAIGQKAVDHLLAMAYFKCAPPDSKEICIDYYLVTKYLGDPVKPNQLKDAEHSKLKQEVLQRYREEFELIHPGDIEADFVYRHVEGKFEADIIDRWGFALPVDRANPYTREHEIF